MLNQKCGISEDELRHGYASKNLHLNNGSSCSIHIKMKAFKNPTNSRYLKHISEDNVPISDNGWGVLGSFRALTVEN